MSKEKQKTIDNNSQDSDTVIDDHSSHSRHSRSHHRNKYKNKEYKPKDDDRRRSRHRSRSRHDYKKQSYDKASRTRHRRHSRSRSRSRSKHRHTSKHHSKHRHHSSSHSHHQSASASIVKTQIPQVIQSVPIQSQSQSQNQPKPKETFDLKKKIEEMTKPVNEIAPISTTDKSKRDKELYVSNLPSGLAPQDIIDLLNTALISIEANTYAGKPIISAWVNTEEEFTLLEFRCVEECLNAFKLNGMTLLNKPIKIGKPMYADEMPNKQTRDMFPTLSSFEKDLNNPYNSSNNSINNKGLSSSVIQMQAGLNAALQAPATSKLLVSNIPKNLDEEDIRQIFKMFGRLKSIEIIKEPNRDKERDSTTKQCHLEYETERETQDALHYAMGLKLKDNILYIKRSIGILPTYTNNSQGQSMQNTQGSLNNQGNIGVLGSVSNPIPSITTEDFIKYRETQPSKIICIKNMASLKDLEDNEDFEDFYYDVIEECKHYGKVIQVKIPRPNGDYGVTGIGKVFVEYANRDGAAWAKKILNGSNFKGKIVEVVFHPEESFKKDQLD